MTKFAIIDTETSGLFDFKKPADDPSQPRLCELAIIRLDENNQVASEWVSLVKPDGWSMSSDSEAFKVHGYTDDHLRQWGQPIRDVLDVYTELVRSGHVIAAYHAQHDLKQLRGEYRRLGLPDLFEETPNTCLMRCWGNKTIPKASGKNGWPKLSDVHRHFAGGDMIGEHTALGDARAALVAFQNAVRLGLLIEPAIHYAKNKPEGTPASGGRQAPF